ncbi:RIP metalloprotease RseP [Patescibacteria group bacterium]|nr:RIP metalloprotease RseP [Patescibacteria group bacterium]
MSHVIIFLIVLSVLVLIHEVGHFVAARFFKVKAEEFGYGFPPRIIGIVKDAGKWKKVSGKDETSYKNTIWSINWLPMGGFVRIKGENADDEHNDADSFHTKPIWQRIIILAAGVTMNWLLAFVLFVTIFSLGAPAILEDIPAGAKIEDRSIRITNILVNKPAAVAGLEVGDRILTIDGQAPDNYQQAIDFIGAKGEEAFDVTYDRNGEQKTVKVEPQFLEEIGKPGIGVAMSDVGIVRFAWYQAIWQGGVATYGYTKAIIMAFGGMVKDLVLLKGFEEDVAGPIGIAVMTGQIAKQGIVPLLQFAAILSINLAVINFLPIPALDGGRVLFLIIEKIRKKAMARKLEASIHQIAFISLIILILLVTIRDLGKYGGVIIGGIKNLIGI